MTQFTASTIFTATDRFSGVVGKMQKSISGFTNKIDGVIGKMGQLGVAIGAGAAFKTILDANVELDKSFASLSAVTGLVGKDFEAFKTLAAKTGRETGTTAAEVAKSMELIGSKKPELLKSADAMNEVTKAAIILSQSGNLDLAATASSLTTIMNQFNLSASEANKTINILAAGTEAGATTVDKISESLEITGASAAMANMSLTDTIATLQVMSLKLADGSQAGTKLNGVINRLQKNNLGYQSGAFSMSDGLKEVSDKMKTFTNESERNAYIMSIFETENKNAALVLINEQDAIQKVKAQITDTNKAYEQAATNTNTLAFKINQLTVKFTDLITTSDQNSMSMRILNKTLSFVSENMGTILVVGASLIALYYGLKVASFLFSASQSILSAIMFITTASTWAAVSANLALAGAIALSLAPILAIIGAITAIILIFKNWGAITNWFSEIWSNLIKWFKDFSFVDFFKNIGKSIFSFFLKPIQMVIELMAKIPGMQSKLQPAIDKIKELRGVDSEINATTNVLPNPDAAKNTAQTNNINKTMQQYLKIDIATSEGTTASVGGSKDIGAKVSSTTNFKR